jgi:hypothetical protein
MMSPRARRLAGSSDLASFSVRWKEQRLEPLIVERVGQRPDGTRASGAVEILAHRALAQPQAASDRALRQPARKPQPQYLSNLPHRQSLAWHPVPPLVGKGSETTFG